MISILSKVHTFIGTIGGKRFVVGFLSLVAIAAKAKFNWDISEETIATIAASYITGQTVLDKLTGGATSSKPENKPAE